MLDASLLSNARQYGPAKSFEWWLDTCWCVAGQATKEAEYREKVADLKARIDSCTARVNSEEEQVNTAKVVPLFHSRCHQSLLSFSNTPLISSPT